LVREINYFYKFFQQLISVIYIDIFIQYELLLS